MKTRILTACVCAVALAGAAAAIQSRAETPAPAAAPAFDAKAESDVIEATAKALTENYIFPDKAAAAVALIRDNLKAGRYAGLERAAFAKKLTEDLQSVTHDKHMRVTVDGAPPPEMADQGPPAPSMFGFERADRLKGNIGYVRLNGFMLPEAFAIGADALMPKLADTDALIIDMRGNNGGDPAAVSYLVSFFVTAGAPVHVNDIVWRKSGTDTYSREVFSTSATPVSYRKPVFLLTGPRTFSGGEEFSYDMQVLKLATLIGETTGGGANPGGDRPLGAGLSIFVPTGRAENPLTKSNWEGVGVKPDVPTSAKDAFSVAYSAALKTAHQAPVAAAGPDAVMAEPLLVLRTTPYPQGEAYIRRQIDGLVKGEQPFDIFSPGTAEALKGPVPAGLQTMMKEQGPVESVRFVRVDPMGADEYEVAFAKTTFVWTLAINGDGKVVITFFRPK
jgi:hypothetical protein